MGSLQKLWAEVRQFCGPYPDPMKLYPEEARSCLRYHQRITRCMPDPSEGEAGEVRTLFFLKKYSGRRECFRVDTEAGEIVPLAFFAYYRGFPEHYDLNIVPNSVLCLEDYLHDRHSGQRPFGKTGEETAPGESSQASPDNCL